MAAAAGSGGGGPRHPWSDLYGQLILISWPRFLGWVGLAYLAIHLLFAALYLLDPAGIGGVDDSLPLPLQAFYFSVETMATIGYGVVYPSSAWAHAVVIVEAFGGLIVLALITGLAFARFERSPQCISFETTVGLLPLEGEPSLLFELHNSRRTTLYAVELRAFWCDTTPEGLSLHTPLPLEWPDGLPLQGDLRVRHRLEAQGPLAALLEPAGQLPAAAGALLISFSAVDGSLEKPVHASHRYAAEQIRRG